MFYYTIKEWIKSPRTKIKVLKKKFKKMDILNQELVYSKVMLFFWLCVLFAV